MENNTLTQLSIGLAAAILVLREVFAFLNHRNGITVHTETLRQVVRQELDSLKQWFRDIHKEN